MKYKKLLPKHISLKADKYQVAVYSKSKKSRIYLGVYEKIEDAIKNRDAFIKENFDSFLSDCFPKGVCFNKKDNSYQFWISYKGKKVYLFSDKNLSNLLEKRINFLDSYK